MLNSGIAYDLASICDCRARVEFSGWWETNGTGPNGNIAGTSSVDYRMVSGPLNPGGGIGGGPEFDNSQDIGDPPFPGKTTYQPQTDSYTMTGSGPDIWDGGDDFQFAYKNVEGDFEAVVHIAGRSNNPGCDRWGRHGLMARYSCHRDSKFSMLETMLPTPGCGDIGGQADLPRYHFRVFHRQNGNNLDWWLAGDGTFPAEGRFPTWQRLVRQGETIFGFLSEDDGTGAPSDWVLIGSDSDLNRPDSLLVGMALHSHSASRAGSIRFDNFEILHREPPPPALCRRAADFASFEFNGPDGSEPGGSRIAMGASGFLPQIQNGRLRITDENFGDSAGAVWFDLPDTEELAEFGFIADFDVLFTKDGIDSNPDANPGDGITFAVLQGRAADLLPSCADGEELTLAPEGFDQYIFIGMDAGDNSHGTYDRKSGVYTSASTSGGDIGSDGDDFLFQYTEISGDFDIAIEILQYAHSTGWGRWGKFGLMARQTDFRNPNNPKIQDETLSRYTMIQAHGPGGEDPARVALRRIHGIAGSEEYGAGGGPIPRFLRLTRRGNIVQGWISNDSGLADGTLNPYNDCNWHPGYAHEWTAQGGMVPRDLLVGFANSEHYSNGAATQTVQFRILEPAPGGVLRTDLLGDGGGALGYQGGNITPRTAGHPNFAVEFDNWINGGIIDDPAGGGSDLTAGALDGNYHIGLNFNGFNKSVLTNVDLGVPVEDLPDIHHSGGIHAEVIYRPNGEIDVFVKQKDGEDDLQLVASAMFWPLRGPIILGFTGATGDATVTAEVDNLVVKRGCSTSEAIFRRGDADGNGKMELTDVIRALNWQFMGDVDLICQDAADIDDDGRVVLTDAIRSLNYQFLGVPDTVPEPPGPFTCGPDVNEDELPECFYPPESCY